MGFDWEGASEGGQSEKMVPGYHKATIDRIVMGSKSKGAFKSKNGDPQIMVIFANDSGEASTMLTLSEKAGWTLARLLSCCGVDLKALKQDGDKAKAKEEKSAELMTKFQADIASATKMGDLANVASAMKKDRRHLIDSHEESLKIVYGQKHKTLAAALAPVEA